MGKDNTISLQLLATEPIPIPHIINARMLCPFACSAHYSTGFDDGIKAGGGYENKIMKTLMYFIK